MMPNSKSAVIFSRVSSADQRDGFSLEAQSSMANQYAKEANLKVVKSWEVDESASKEKDRKHFFAMIDFIGKHDIKDVVFDKIDRACRGLESAVVIEKTIEKGVRFHFTRDHLVVDQNSPSQEKLRFYLGVILGKYYIDNLRSEINKGRQARIKAGHFPGKAPFGYLNHRESPNGRSTIIWAPQHAETAREVFELYATGNYSLQQLAERLSHKVSTRKFSKRIVEEMIGNPFYYGMIRLKGQIVGRGAHEPLIDKKLWDQCQKVRGIRAQQLLGGRQIAGPTKPLMGLIKCGKCGHTVTGEVKKQKAKQYVYYHCANHACTERRRNVRQEVLMEALKAAFEVFRKLTPKATSAFLKTMENRLEDLDLYTQEETAKLAQKRLSIRKKILAVERLHAEGGLSKEEYNEVLRIRELALSQVEAEIDGYMSADRKTFEMGRRVIETLHKSFNFMGLNGNDLEKIELAKLVLSNFLLKGPTLRYDYQKPFDVLVNLVGVPVWWRRRELKGVIHCILEVFPVFYLGFFRLCSSRFSIIRHSFHSPITHNFVQKGIRFAHAFSIFCLRRELSTRPFSWSRKEPFMTQT